MAVPNVNISGVQR